MRDTLNNNPVVQAVALGLLTLAVAFLLFTRVVNRDGGAEPVPSEPAPRPRSTRSSFASSAFRSANADPARSALKACGPVADLEV